MKFWCVICVIGICQITYTHQDKYNHVTKLCDKIIRSLHTEHIPYLETYKEKISDSFYKTQIRWNYKIESYPVLRRENVCCPGYNEVGNNMCQPICDPVCGNGTCLMPNVCKCDVGYFPLPLRSSKFVCTAVCNRKCTNGKCTAPDVCTCNDQYSMTDNGCQPICDPPCGKGAYCVAPGHCECLSGYVHFKNVTSVDLYRDLHRSCQPTCENKCVNGDCDAYNTCICHDGYELDPDNLFVCKPKCHDCYYGICTAPNVCTCYNGYSLGKSGMCEPICKKPCVNGTCVAPESCRCHEGYGLLDFSPYVCKPICAFCKKGKCISPGVCVCYEGYQLHNYTQSHPPSYCHPICEIPCEPLGRCFEPNKCTCFRGYEWTGETQMNRSVGNDTSFCTPICNPPCINGICKKPGICECNLGYRLVKPANISLPDSDDNPTDLGYTNGRNRCEPICDPNCKNGTCVAPDFCMCDDGFTLAHTNIEDQSGRVVFRNGTENTCVPSCESCDDGECVAPNECRCHAGFLKINDTCIYMCESTCATHGECIAESRTCKCNHGWNGIQCDQPDVCVLMLNDDENRTRQLKVIEERNVTIEHVLVNNPACPECINKLNDDTLCFKMYLNDTKNTTRIGCLINEECLQLSEYKVQKKFITLSGVIIGLGILILTGAIAIYVLLRKYRNKQENLDVQRVLMQGLIEEAED